MSKSPHRLRGDAADCWRAILIGEILRAVGGPATVRSGPTIRLPRAGRWQDGLGRIAPALDDALGATAFAVAWRWACAEAGANAWPGFELIARKAVDGAVTVGPGTPLAWDLGEVGAAVVGTSMVGGRTWRLALAPVVDISVSIPGAADWTEVDRMADITAAWFDAPWEVVRGG